MRTSNSIQVKYEKAFNDKINAFKNHSKYNWLREYSDTAIANHTGAGFLQIRAADFMDRIIAMPINYIEDWLDGKNELQWTKEFEANLGDFKKTLIIN